MKIRDAHEHTSTSSAHAADGHWENEAKAEGRIKGRNRREPGNKAGMGGKQS